MKKIIAGNWKLNKNPDETKQFVKKIFDCNVPLPSSELIIFPSDLCVYSALETCESNPSKLKIGIQNCYWEGKGAFTGESSAEVAQKMGVAYVLLGHSERRQYFGENDIHLARKVAYVQSLGLIPLLCVGESLQERERGDTFQVITRQISEGLAKASQKSKLVVAYEPVWAIGTGKVATPEQVQEVHQHLFSLLNKFNFNEIPLLYGGSVKPENAKTLSSLPHVDGFLIGGASLEAESFLAIASQAEFHSK